MSDEIKSDEAKSDGIKPHAHTHDHSHQIKTDENPAKRHKKGKPKLPVSILTGYLGAGKTTLLNYLLAEQKDKKLAVIENEVGEVSIDDALVEQKHEDLAEELIVLDNGCVCCTIRGDLIKTLHNLAAKCKDGLALDGVLIELTGAADPAPVVQTFMMDDGVRKAFYVDNVITLVDAKHIEQHLDEIKPEGAENEAIEQVAFADRMILNKTDLVSEADLTRVEARLRTINKFAPIQRSTQSQVSVDSVLNIRGFDVNKILEMDPEFLNTDGEHEHDASVSSISITQEGEVHSGLMNDWVNTILKDMGANIYRMKGVVAVQRSEKKFVYQAVHMIFEGEFDEPWAPGEKRENKLVFIGKNLDKDAIRSGFAACLVTPENRAKIDALERLQAVEQLASRLLGAAARDDTPQMKQLLALGVPVNYSNRVGQTSLHLSCLWGHIRGTELLLAAGAPIDQKNTLAGDTPLHMTAGGRGKIAGRITCAKKLREVGANLRVQNGGGLMPHQSVDVEGETDKAAVKELLQVLTP